MRTLPELAQQVLDVQDACNLSGVVHAWSRAITNLRELMPTAGTDALNRHPINKLWADKVAHLTGTQYLMCQAVDDAYGVVSEMAASKSGPVNPCNCGDVNCAAQPGHCGAYKTTEPLKDSKVRMTRAQYKALRRKAGKCVPSEEVAELRNLRCDVDTENDDNLVVTVPGPHEVELIDDTEPLKDSMHPQGL